MTGNGKNGNGKDGSDIRVIYNAAVKAIKPYLGDNLEQNIGTLDVGKQVDIADKVHRFLDAFKTCNKDAIDEDTYNAFHRAADKLLLTLSDVESRLGMYSTPAVMTKAYYRIKNGELPNAIATEFEYEYQPKEPEATVTANAALNFEDFMKGMDRLNAKNEEFGERLAKIPPYDESFHVAFMAKTEENKKKVEAMKARTEVRKTESAQIG